MGIPQDALADCSRLLANYYLQKYDKFAAMICAKAGASYFRYADDQMILVNETNSVDALMLLLTRNLGRHGLRVNQKKVEIWTVKELQKHRCRDIQAVFANKGDNKDPKLVRKFVDAYLKLSDKKLAATWNGGLPLLNRLLWANIESLPKKLLEKLLTRYTAPEYLIRAEKDKLVRVSQLNSKRKKPIDLNKRIKELGQQAMHNAFHHEAVGFAREMKNRTLTGFFTKRLAEIETQMENNRIS